MKRHLLAAFAVLIAFALPATAQEQAEAPAAPPDHPAEALVRGLVHAIDAFDLDRFVGSFSEDATVFYPIAGMAERVGGREALAERQGQVFAHLRKQFAEAGHTTPPFFGLEITNLHTQVLAPAIAIVTYHVDRGTHLGRRTAVVQEIEGTWQIVSFHSSNMDRPTG